MACLKNKGSSFLILTTLILLFFSFFTRPVAAKNDVVYRGNQRSALDGANSTDFVLARERTFRKDPLDSLHYYNGGWNISNGHYIASVVYTGSPLFLAAALWFVSFGLFLLLLCMCVCCCGRRRYGYSKLAYALSLIFLSLFTVAALIGSAVLYTGQAKFRDSTGSTLDFVLQQADSTVDNLKNVSSYLTAAKSVGVDQVFLPRHIQNNIDHVNHMIMTAANTLESATVNNKDNIFRYLDAVSLILVVVATAMLGLDLLGFLLSITGLQFLVYFLVVFGWILVSITFVLCGLFLVLHNATGDSCVAMHEWVNNPTAHTALDRIIPCVDPTTSREARSLSRDAAFQMVGLVNGVLANVSNGNFPSSAGPLFYNQSGPSVPLLCNPYNPDKTDRRTCATGEVDLNNATQVWRNYECRVTRSNMCSSVGRLTPSMYDEVSRAVNVSYGLHHYGPFLSHLADCTFLRDTFDTIYDRHCVGLRRYSQWVYIGLVMVSTAVMLSLISWFVYARERRHRKYSRLDQRKGP